MTADVKILGDIHTQLAMTYRQLVSPRQEPLFTKDGEPVMVEGVHATRTVYPTAAELAAANAFLKQNNITAAPEEDSSLDALRDQLAQRRRRAPPVMPDLDADFGSMQ
jgi:hypothetical protein